MEGGRVGYYEHTHSDGECAECGSWISLGEPVNAAAYDPHTGTLVVATRKFISRLVWDDDTKDLAPLIGVKPAHEYDDYRTFRPHHMCYGTVRRLTIAPDGTIYALTGDELTCIRIIRRMRTIGRLNLVEPTLINDMSIHPDTGVMTFLTTFNVQRAEPPQIHPYTHIHTTQVVPSTWCSCCTFHHRPLCAFLHVTTDGVPYRTYNTDIIAALPSDALLFPQWSGRILTAECRDGVMFAVSDVFELNKTTLKSLIRVENPAGDSGAKREAIVLTLATFNKDVARVMLCLGDDSRIYAVSNKGDVYAYDAPIADSTWRRRQWAVTQWVVLRQGPPSVCRRKDRKDRKEKVD